MLTVLRFCLVSLFSIAAISLPADVPNTDCPQFNNGKTYKIAFVFQVLAKPEIPEEDVAFLSNALVIATCEILCSDATCTLKAKTTSIEGLMSTRFYTTYIIIPSQNKNTIKLIKAKWKSIIKEYDNQHKKRLSWSIEINENKGE